MPENGCGLLPHWGWDMEDWKEILKDADEDYLIGIANKGIVKRAYKDKEEGNYEVLSSGDSEGEATVRVGAESVKIKSPLGESVCSCPSRTICRHVVLGILALKERMEEEPGAGAELLEGGPAEEGPKPGTEQPAGEGNGAKDGQPVDKQGLGQKVREEIAAYPLSSIRRIMGERQLQAAINQIKSKQFGNITYSSTVTVELPWMGQKVKLLSPLEYSSCNCHKKEFCVHKACAVLWCKLEAGQLTVEELEKEAYKKPESDWKQIKDTAKQMETFLEELLNIGLARFSPDALEHMERLAIVSHNARLAKFEGYWRALKDSYDSYLKRKASFRLSKLAEQTAKLYSRAKLLLEAEESGEIDGLSGEFRAEYAPAGDLELTGIAMEHFESQAGYEGETIYFLERNTKEWYTFTSAMPVFYEKSGRRRRGGKAGAPWGLALSMEELAKARIALTGAKSDGRRRLSSSQDTKGELIAGAGKGPRLYTEDLGGWYYRDFDRLYEERINRKNISWLEEKEEEGMDLVFLRPASLKRACFSETEQKLFMHLYDRESREVIVEVAYSQKEAWGIRYLERIEEHNPPCFFGKIYLKNGKIRMYPIAVLEKGELAEEEGAEEREENRLNKGKPFDGESWPNGEKRFLEGKSEGSKPGNEEKEKALETLLQDAADLLEELYQSGFHTVHDSTLQALGETEKLAGQYGMEYLSDKIKNLEKALSMRRHQLNANAMPDNLVEIYAGLIEYLYLCRTKITLDIGRNYYSRGQRESHINRKGASCHDESKRFMEQ